MDAGLGICLGVFLNFFALICFSTLVKAGLAFLLVGGPILAGLTVFTVFLVVGMSLAGGLLLMNELQRREDLQNLNRHFLDLEAEPLPEPLPPLNDQDLFPTNFTSGFLFALYYSVKGSFLGFFRAEIPAFMIYAFIQFFFELFLDFLVTFILSLVANPILAVIASVLSCLACMGVLLSVMLEFGQNFTGIFIDNQARYTRSEPFIGFFAGLQYSMRSVMRGLFFNPIRNLVWFVKGGLGILFNQLTHAIWGAPPERADQPLNDAQEHALGAQNIHQTSVHQTVSESAKRLRDKYGNNLSGSDLSTALADLNKKYDKFVGSEVKYSGLRKTWDGFVWTLGFDLETNVVALDLKKPLHAAHRALKKLTDESYVFADEASRVSTRELLGLIYLAIQQQGKEAANRAIQDAREAAEVKGESFVEQDKNAWVEKVTKEFEEGAYAALTRGLYEAQRGYNLEGAVVGVDDGGPDRSICTSGTFNKLVESMIGALPECRIKPTVAAMTYRVPAMISEAAAQYLAQSSVSIGTLKKVVLEDKCLEEIWDRILPDLIHEFGVHFDSYQPRAQGESNVDYIARITKMLECDFAGNYRTLDNPGSNDRISRVIVNRAALKYLCDEKSAVDIQTLDAILEVRHVGPVWEQIKVRVSEEWCLLMGEGGEQDRLAPTKSWFQRLITWDWKAKVPSQEKVAFKKTQLLPEQIRGIVVNKEAMCYLQDHPEANFAEEKTFERVWSQIQNRVLVAMKTSLNSMYKEACFNEDEKWFDAFCQAAKGSEVFPCVRNFRVAPAAAPALLLNSRQALGINAGRDSSILTGVRIPIPDPSLVPVNQDNAQEIRRTGNGFNV